MKPASSLVLCLLASVFIVEQNRNALSQVSAETGAQGMIEICKKDTPEDYEPGFWNREVVVPVGAVFGDVCAIDDPSGDWIRLRVITLAVGRIADRQRCVRVPAKISTREDWGRKHVGPVIEVIVPQAKRLLEIVRWGDGPAPPSKLAPWADVPIVEAVVATEFKPPK